VRGRRRGRLALVAHAAFPADPRLRRQVDALLAAGYEVDVFSLRERGEAPQGLDGGLRVVRLPVSRRFVGFAGHLAEYAAFTVLAAARLGWEQRTRRYRLVQVATLPDFLVAAATVPKLAGVPLLLDLHEDMPAFFADRFGRRALRPLAPVIDGVARGAAAVADRIITVHEPLRELAIRRGVPADKIAVVMNGADERVFDPNRHPRRPFMADGQLRLIHHSALQRIYGLEIAVRAVAELAAERSAPTVRLDVYGEGPDRHRIETAIAARGVADRVTLHGRVPLDDLPALLADADVGLVPSLPEPYMHYSLSTKLLEYAAMGVPIIASDLRTFRAHLNDAAVCYVPGGDPAALAAAIAETARDPGVARARADEARRQAAPYAWSVQARRYLDIVGQLVAS
jgi:glycosyltransferase involved in cell wall biosynthesis